MINSKHHTLKLGLLVTTGLFLFILAIYFLGANQNLFTSKIMVKSYLVDAAGLIEGNKIRYAGVTVGTVTDVQIVSDTSVMVGMSINQKVREFIRKDSKVEIGQEGLMGSKILLIHPGTMGAGPIEDNDVLVSIQALTIDDLLRDAETVIANSRVVLSNLADISNKINHGEGDLAMLLNENRMATRVDQISEQLLLISTNTNEVIQKINHGDGDLGKLVNDSLITGSTVQLLNKFNEVSMQVAGLLGELQLFANELTQGDGLAHQVTYDSEMTQKVDSTITNLNNGIDEIVETAQAIRESWILNVFSGKKKRQ
ncbi:MlaD family protein [Mangrovibacterium sp.]|uniref:MlaD family protein n=1 Tax=Mangrovibacterium sp. TaxID=1961364 RepID=UPI003561DC89